jgi:hypothetical protein
MMVVRTQVQEAKANETAVSISTCVCMDPVSSGALGAVRAVNSPGTSPRLSRISWSTSTRAASAISDRRMLSFSVT